VKRNATRSLGRGLPRYKAVKLELVRALSSGTIGVDQPLPTEKQLAVRHRVSVGTIRRAMDELVAEHVVVRQQGRGTFIARFSPELLLNRFWPVFRRDGTREIPIVQTLRFEEQRADAGAARALGLRGGALLHRIVNLLLLEGNPVLLDEVRIAKALLPGLTEQVFVARENTMYGFYQSAYGINIIRVVDRLHAVAADAESARRLGVPAGSALLQSTRIAYTFEDRPVELRRTLMHTGAYEYRNAIGGKAST
jgi:GntR family transcriptional regulator